MIKYAEFLRFRQIFKPKRRQILSNVFKSDVRKQNNKLGSDL